MLQLGEILYWLIRYLLVVESLPGGKTAFPSYSYTFSAENSQSTGIKEE